MASNTTTFGAICMDGHGWKPHQGCDRDGANKLVCILYSVQEGVTNLANEVSFACTCCENHNSVEFPTQAVTSQLQV